jgi:hypothetical protein
MEIKREAKTEENNFEMKLSDFEPKSEANNNQNNTEPNCPKKHLEKDEENKKREEINFNKEKEKEEIVDIFASKEKCQEDIKSGPLLELYLQQSNNDIDTKKVKAKKKITKAPKWRKAKKSPKIKNIQKKHLIRNDKRNKTHVRKKKFKGIKPKKAEKTENNNLNDDGKEYSYNFDLIENGFYENTYFPIYPWDIGTFKNMSEELSSDEKLTLENVMVESNHSISSLLFNNERFLPTINYGDYDEGLNALEFGNENDNTNYKTGEDQ